MFNIARPASQSTQAFIMKWTDQAVARCVLAAGIQVYRIEGGVNCGVLDAPNRSKQTM
jgi:hypothetical protein